MKKRAVCMTIHFLILVMFFASLTGCATRGQIYEPIEPVIWQEDYPVLIVEVQTNVPTTPEIYLEQLEGSTVGRIRDMNLYQSVYSSRQSIDPQFDLKLLITITGYRGVSSGARDAFGVLAGRASIEATFNLIDFATNEILSEVTSKGMSGGSAFSGGTSTGIERLAEQAAEFTKASLINPVINRGQL